MHRQSDMSRGSRYLLECLCFLGPQNNLWLRGSDDLPCGQGSRYGEHSQKAIAETDGKRLDGFT